MQNQPSSFSTRHPLLFSAFLLGMAMVVFITAMAFLRVESGKGLRGLLAPATSLGLVRVEGTIADSDKLVSWIRQLEDDDSVKGVLVRINSPGGLVAPSQEIYAELRRASDKKPVVASMDSFAASGGYYIAAAADHIVANPGSLTGSIGVKLEMYNIQELVRKVGISEIQVTSGDMKGAGSPMQKLSPQQRNYFESLVKDMHDQFVSDVADARDMPKDQVQALADGRAYTGRQALELGLVDELGGLYDALETLQQLTHVPDGTPIREGPPDERNFMGAFKASIRLKMADMISIMDALTPRLVPLFK